MPVISKSRLKTLLVQEQQLKINNCDIPLHGQHSPPALNSVIAKLFAEYFHTPTLKHTELILKLILAHKYKSFKRNPVKKVPNNIESKFWNLVSFRANSVKCVVCAGARRPSIHFLQSATSAYHSREKCCYHFSKSTHELKLNSLQKKTW